MLTLQKIIILNGNYSLDFHSIVQSFAHLVSRAPLIVLQLLC